MADDSRGPSNLTDLRGRLGYSPDVVGLACRRMAAARERTGLSRPAFAASLRSLLGWTPAPEMIKHWESTVAPPGEVAEAAGIAAARAGSPLVTDNGPGHAALTSSTAADVDQAIGAMQAFRMADLRVGGGHPRVVELDTDPDAQAMFTAASAVTEMAGWMAHDAGSDDVARRHFSRSLYLVRSGCDRRVKAHVLASMSHLEEHLRRPDSAIRFAQAGREALAGGPRNPDLEARLYAMEARAQAALRDATECVRLLASAEKALGSRQDEEPSCWVGSFDEGSLANEAARCMRHLGDLAEVQRQAARIIALRPANRPRSRAFGQLMLAATLADQGKHEEACTVAAAVLDATPALGSHIVVQQLRDLTRLLEPHRSARPVNDFLTRLDSDIRQRLWLIRQPGGEGQELPATSGGSG